MVVIIAEKYSVAKIIAETLGAGQRLPLKSNPKISHWEFSLNGEPAVLCHACGHLISLSSPVSYGENFSKWDDEHFPCLPVNYKKHILKDTKEYYDFISLWIDKADWLISATDNDREGDLIFSYIYEAKQCRKPYKRAVFDDMTKESLIYAFAHLVDGKERLGIEYSGRSRDISDWLIGINLTILFTVLAGNNTLLHIGRVQTATLALVVEREKQIKAFESSVSYKIIGLFSDNQGNFFEAENDMVFESKQKAEEFLKKLPLENNIINDYKEKQKSENAPLLYNTTSLLSDVSKLYHISLEEISAITEQLYLKKLITYPRTASQHLPEVMKSESIKNILKALFSEKYKNIAIPQNEWTEFTKRHFNDSKLESHTAIIPTGNINNEVLSENENLVYDLICRSIIKIIYPKAVYIQQKLQVRAGEYNFTAVGKKLCNKGWCAIDDRKRIFNPLPCVLKGTYVTASYKIKEIEKKPPVRYTCATLLESMELAGRYIEDEELRTVMKLNNRSLGTSSTRDKIIKKLLTDGYLLLKNQNLYPSEKGCWLIEHFPINELKNATFTAEIEKKLLDIEKNKIDARAFDRYISNLVRDWSIILKGSTKEKYAADTLPCPLCGNAVKKGKYGWYCSAKCGLSINNMVAGKKISDNQANQLIKTGKTAVLKGFKNREGQSFDSKLALNSQGKVIFIK